MKKRQINRAKRVSAGCANHGSCDRCRDSRTYSNEHRRPLGDDEGPLREDTHMGLYLCKGCDDIKDSDYDAPVEVNDHLYCEGCHEWAQKAWEETYRRGDETPEEATENFTKYLEEN